MAVKVTDKMTDEGNKLKKMLEELSKLQVSVGFQHGEATEDDGTDICDIAAWNELGTVNMPARPFLRKSVDENEAKIVAFMKAMKGQILEGADAKQILNQIGIFQKDLVQEKITNGDFEPNAPSTIKRKGSDKPLIDTGRMRQSVNYVIKKKGSGK